MAHSTMIRGGLATGQRGACPGGKSRVIEMQLRPREVRRLAGNACGAQILCVAGTLWITQPQDGEDYLLHAGEKFTVTRPGPVVVQGMAAA